MKKIVSIFTVLLMLVASSAFAAKSGLPAYLNGTLDATLTGSASGTYLVYTGFSVNGTNTVDDSVGGYGSMTFFGPNSTIDKRNHVLMNGSGSAGGALNGTLFFTNGTRLIRSDLFLGVQPAAIPSVFDFETTYGSISGLVGQAATNSTWKNATVYVPAGAYQLLVGLANSSFNMTANGTDKTVGGASATNNTAAGTSMTMPILYANGTFTGIESTSDVWDYYAFGQDEGAPFFTIAQVKINTADGANNAQVKSLVDNGTETKNTTSWVTYNATGIASGNMALTNTMGDYRDLLQNSTINADQNLITGFVDEEINGRCFVVMIKNGSTLSTADLSNRGYKSIFLGSKTGFEKGNATSGISSYVFNENLLVTDGFSRVVNTVEAGGNHNLIFLQEDTDLDGYSAAVATTSQFGLTQSNMTVYKADGDTIVSNFYGKQSADKTFSVGIMEYHNASSDSHYTYGLAFLMPDNAVTYEVTAAPVGYQHNASLTGAAIVTNFVQNSSEAYSSVGLKARWTGIPSNFTPLTEAKGYAATFDVSNRGDLYYTAQYKILGLGGKIQNLKLYKVNPFNTSSRALNYASTVATGTDGAWWISTNTGGGYLAQDSVLDPTQNYYVNWVVKDNGSYDANNTVAKGIVDPVVLGSVPTATSSSSSSGCVFNPAAGFGLEWLLLMLAPMVAIVRSRFKK